MLQAGTVWSVLGLSVAAAAVCAPGSGEAVRVKAVNEDWSIALEDGRMVRLAGIDPVQATAEDPARGEDARQKLASWLVGRAAELQASGAGLDRWGRLDGVVFAAGDPPAGPVSVALALVDAGLARARPDAGAEPPCWSATLATETAARLARTGLWQDPAYAVLHPDDQGALEAALGTMVLLEGRVSRVGYGRSRVFIDLGAKGRVVTLSLAKRDLFILDQVGLNGARLLGATVRVRGDLEERSEFSIDIDTAAAVEVLSRPGTDPAAMTPGGAAGRP